MKKQKKIKKYFTFFIIMLIAFNSCIEEAPDTKTEFTIYNYSSKNVELFVSNFEIGASVYEDATLTIQSNESISHEYYDVLGLHPFPLGAASDSVCITFDDRISVSYLRTDTVPRNPLLLQNYTGGQVGEYRYEYAYSITEEDYVNALVNYE